MRPREPVITSIIGVSGRSRTILGTLLVLALTLTIGARSAWCATSRDGSLAKLAGSRFSNLTRAELALLKFVESNPAEAGGFAVAGPNANSDEPSNDPAHADEWGKDREVRAELIRWLCVDPDAVRRIDPQGLRLLGAKIVGSLNLSLARVPFAIALRNCSIASPINLASAQIGDLDLSGSYTGPIYAPLIEVARLLTLGNGFHASGQVFLVKAKIGALSATDGHFKYLPETEPVDYYHAPFRPALNLADAQIQGFVAMDRGFESRGAVVMDHARIGGELVCASARFMNPGNVALYAAGAEIDGSVFLWGEIPSVAGAQNPFEADGLLEFEFVRVGNVFSVDGARLSGKAFNAYGGLLAVGLNVRQAFVWRRVSLEKGAQLTLRDASVGFIVDQERGWPPPGNLLIDGFVYSSFDVHPGDSPWDAHTRLRWLALQPPGFHLQPYRQLAKVLRQSGDDRGAIQVLIAQEDARYRQFGLPGRIAGDFLKATIGYGYKPFRTVGWSLLVVLIGWAVVWMAKRAGVMRATWPENAPSSEPHYENLHPFLYSLDAFLPFVNLHQEHYWWPNSQLSGECAILGHQFRLRGSLVRYYLWLQVMSGWLLSAILVAGVTGLMRSD